MKETSRIHSADPDAAVFIERFERIYSSLTDEPAAAAPPTTDSEFDLPDFELDSGGVRRPESAKTGHVQSPAESQVSDLEEAFAILRASEKKN